MTVRLEPTQGPGRALSSTRLFPTWKYAGHGDWIFTAGQGTINGESVPSVRDPDLVGPLNAFDANYSATSLTVTIDTGEAVVEGAYIGSDDSTVTDSAGNVVHDVTLDASTNKQDVFLGYDHTATDVDALIIGKSGAFTSADQPRVHIWTFDTDADGVTAARSHRPIGEQVNVENTRYEGGGVAVDAAGDSTTLGGRSLTTLVRDVRTITLPMAQIPDGDAARTRLDIGPDDGKLIQQNHVTTANDSPTGLQTAVHAGDGTILYEDESTITRGTPDSPVAGPWARAFLEFRLENNTGGQITASAEFTLLIE